MRSKERERECRKRERRLSLFFTKLITIVSLDRNDRAGTYKVCQSAPITTKNLPLPRAYFEERKISTQKKKDLLSLVSDGIIPEYAAQYFSSLPADKSVKDVQYYDDDDINLLDEEIEIHNLEF